MYNINLTEQIFMGNLDKILNIISAICYILFVLIAIIVCFNMNKRIKYLLKAVNVLIHAHNFKNYRSACQTVEDLGALTSPDAEQRTQLERARKTISDFESSYNVEDSKNN